MHFRLHADPTIILKLIRIKLIIRLLLSDYIVQPLLRLQQRQLLKALMLVQVSYQPQQSENVIQRQSFGRVFVLLRQELLILPIYQMKMELYLSRSIVETLVVKFVNNFSLN
ncbi:Hypothetical_protein [Hexamita inflata]|uniref:Hypothetical_protein n=1 Tax=Hexamita inflata TaxID=28002 RepID=A0AA86P7P4_9EUKA|nr:Hypothetical protein HINF_LOCUS19659 [Hexamita inflata]CAI9965555.1 Hypothetical protein HINF_LOCUS53200 [Hexamita inflata]